MLYKTIVFLPLIAFLVTGLFGRSLGDKLSQFITSGFVTISAVLSWVAFYAVAMNHGGTVDVHVLSWVTSGTLNFNWALHIDTLTAVMLVVVNTVSAIVHWYSVGYMSHDPDKPRFFAYLSLFTFSMLMLVTADNLIQMFMGWEGVGLASYLLIGFWYKKPSANAAAIKAFVVNRVGDFGFSLGIFATFLVFGTVEFTEIFAQLDTYKDHHILFLGHEWHTLTIICLLLFVGAMGKSAQLGLHTWLPDAMEGPTPVSALIHAATMVTAGVFLVARFSPMFEMSETALYVVTIVGASTAFFAATVGLVQNDIKRVIAYSTCSQLGYMFFALGVGAFGGGIFHLFTHAFFKALLFLGAGSVIHAMSDEQDMRKMGGLWKKIPWTFAFMLIGTLALTGFPLTAGYYSKDLIIEAAYASDMAGSQFAFVMGVTAAFMTSFYSWRLIFMTFFGESRADKKVQDHVHESGANMLVPLAALATGALFAGWYFHDVFIGDARFEFWNGAVMTVANDVMDAAHHVPFAVVAAPFVVMVLGFLLAYQMYIRRPDLPDAIAKTWDGVYAFLLNKWYFDELYDFVFIRGAQKLGRIFWKRGDKQVIDGLGPDGVSALINAIANRVRVIQSGYVYHYAFAMLIGVAAVVTWFMTTASH